MTHAELLVHLLTNAADEGFDGVEVHGANGELLLYCCLEMPDAMDKAKTYTML